MNRGKRTRGNQSSFAIDNELVDLCDRMRAAVLAQSGYPITRSALIRKIIRDAAAQLPKASK